MGRGRPVLELLPGQEGVLERALEEGFTWADAALMAGMSVTAARRLRDEAEMAGDSWIVAREAVGPGRRLRRYRYLTGGQRAELGRRLRLLRKWAWAGGGGPHGRWHMLPPEGLEELAEFEWTDPFEDGLVPPTDDGRSA